jgi:hypothetical protein
MASARGQTIALPNLSGCDEGDTGQPSPFHSGGRVKSKGGQFVVLSYFAYRNHRIAKSKGPYHSFVHSAPGQPQRGWFGIVFGRLLRSQRIAKARGQTIALPNLSGCDEGDTGQPSPFHSGGRVKSKGGQFVVLSYFAYRNHRIAKSKGPYHASSIPRPPSRKGDGSESCLAGFFGASGLPGR